MKSVRDSRFIKQLYQRHAHIHLTGPIDPHRWIDVDLPNITFMDTRGPLFTLRVNRRGEVIGAEGHVGIMTFHKYILFDPKATTPLVKRFLIRHGFLREGGTSWKTQSKKKA